MLVEVEELQGYMSGLDLDVDQSLSLEDVLAGLQRELERYCQRPLERMERVEVIHPDEFGRLWPKATPVWSVSTAGFVPGGGEFSNQIVSGGGSWYPTYGLGLGGGGGPVTVTYVGGCDEADVADAKSAILRVAAREATTRHSDTLDPNDLSAKKVDPEDRKRPIGWTPEELAKFDRLRRRTVR